MNALGCPYNKHGYSADGVKVPTWCPLTEALYKETTIQQPPPDETFSFHILNPSCIDPSIESPTINLDLPLEGQPSLEDLINFVPNKIVCDL